MTEPNAPAASAEDEESAGVRPDVEGPATAGSPTGVSAADAAATRLGEVAEAPLEQHVEIYEDVHRTLQEGLADLDEQ